MDDSSDMTEDLDAPEARDIRLSREGQRLIPDLHEDSYSVHDVANLLGMNPEVIQHAVRTGELQAERMGHDIVCIHRADLLAWLNARGPGL